MFKYFSYVPLVTLIQWDVTNKVEYFDKIDDIFLFVK